MFIAPLQAQSSLPGTPVPAAEVDPDVQLLLTLAQDFDPTLFAWPSGWYAYDGYTYQFFAISNVYAGVKNETVYLMGGAYGNSPVPAGSLSAVLARLKDHTNANVLELSQNTSMVFEYPGPLGPVPAQTFTIDSKLPTGWTLQPSAAWISLSQSSGTTGAGGNISVTINEQALGLAKGRHTASVLVRNMDDHHLSVHLPIVLYVVDPGMAVIQATADVLDFDATFVVTDAKRNRLYFSDQYSKRVYQVDAASGLTTRYFQFSKVPERMAVSPDGDKLYVALLDQPHTYYLGSVEQSGAIGIINMAQQTLLGSFAVDVDPYDLVVNASGKLVVSSGSGQWTSLGAYDAATGNKLGEQSIRHLSRLALHPNQEWVYAADTDLSPSDINKFDISGSGITALGDSPYHGGHRIDGNVWAAPNGKHLYTRGGDVFLASSMQFVTSLLAPDETVKDLAFDAELNRVVVLTASSKLLTYGLANFQLISTLATDFSDPYFVEVIGGDIVVVDRVLGEYRLKRF